MKNIEILLKNYHKKIGIELGKSSWFLVNQDIIDSFASLTMDPQFIHIDPKRAVLDTPFGSTIAHGFLVLSLSTKFALEALETPKNEKMSINYGFNKVRFINPVKCNNLIRGVFVLKDVKQRSACEILFTHQLSVEIKGQSKPALVCEWLGLSIFK